MPIEYRVVCPDRPDLGTMTPRDPANRAVAEAYAEDLRYGRAVTLLGVHIPATPARVEFRHLTEWAEVPPSVEGVPV